MVPLGQHYTTIGRSEVYKQLMLRDP
ncbi:protein of unknown function [Candidatus Methylomirabilis oxygeniifera]|uniref:Uncharacterized protein n=1 Tax=Methylomirabilis oxygeniifera TaxID=671143 RepID=D5MLN7_METO1|nr:protein of unknown function [Candidatus Methylomirabilis oxyfera]